MKKLLKKLKSWWRKRKREKAKKKAQRKPLEFSKMLAIWAVFIATAAAVASYVLAAFYRRPSRTSPRPSSRPASGI